MSEYYLAYIRGMRLGCTINPGAQSLMEIWNVRKIPYRWRLGLFRCQEVPIFLIPRTGSMANLANQT